MNLQLRVHILGTHEKEKSWFLYLCNRKFKLHRSRRSGRRPKVVRIVTNAHQSRATSIWANTEVEVIEYGELQDVARPIGSQSVSLRAALRETGGRIEARYKPSKPLADGY